MFLRGAVFLVLALSLAQAIPTGTEAEIAYVPQSLGPNEAPVMMVRRLRSSPADEKTQGSSSSVSTSIENSKKKPQEIVHAPSAIPSSVDVEKLDTNQARAIQQMQEANDAQNAAMHPSAHPKGEGEAADLRSSAASASASSSASFLETDSVPLPNADVINVGAIADAVKAAFSRAAEAHAAAEFEESEKVPDSADQAEMPPSQAFVESEVEEQDQASAEDQFQDHGEGENEGEFEDYAEQEEQDQFEGEEGQGEQDAAYDGEEQYSEQDAEEEGAFVEGQGEHHDEY